MPRKTRYASLGGGGGVRSPSVHHDGDVYYEYDQRPLYSPRPDSAASTSSMEFLHRIGGIPTPFQEAVVVQSPATSIRSWTQSAAGNNGGVNSSNATVLRRRSSGDRRPVVSADGHAIGSSVDAVELYYNRHEQAQQIQSYNDYLVNCRYIQETQVHFLNRVWTRAFVFFLLLQDGLSFEKFLNKLRGEFLIKFWERGFAFFVRSLYFCFYDS